MISRLMNQNIVVVFHLLFISSLFIGATFLLLHLIVISHLNKLQFNSKRSINKEVSFV
jgi:hypothetical protein